MASFVSFLLNKGPSNAPTPPPADVASLLSFLLVLLSKIAFKKTQLPGGKFVQVKKKCKRFPYCNQGDINALNLSENEDMQIAIQNISRKYGLTEDKIIEIILKETNTNKN